MVAELKGISLQLLDNGSISWVTATLNILVSYLSVQLTPYIELSLSMYWLLLLGLWPRPPCVWERFICRQTGKERNYSREMWWCLRRKGLLIRSLPLIEAETGSGFGSWYQVFYRDKIMTSYAISFTVLTRFFRCIIVWNWVHTQDSGEWIQIKRGLTD